MKPAQPWNNWQVFLLYYVNSLEPDSEIKGHYVDFITRELHALLKSGKDGSVVIRITFDDCENVHQLSIICMDPFHPAIPVAVLEVWILAF